MLLRSPVPRSRPSAPWSDPRPAGHAQGPAEAPAHLAATLLFQLVVNGLVVGGLVGLVALGLALIFGVMRVVNFAHGALTLIARPRTHLLADPPSLEFGVLTPTRVD